MVPRHWDQAAHTAPQDAGAPEIAKRASRKGEWVFRELDKIAGRPSVTPVRRYVSGESHLFQGKQYRLALEPSNDPHVQLDGDRMILFARNPHDGSHCRRVLLGFYRLQARDVFPARLAAMLPPFERKDLEQRPHLVIRAMSKRWGSYTTSGRIVLNLDLIRAAPDLLDYVICHELAHAFHGDHGFEWRDLLATIMPDWEMRKALLERKLR